MTEEERRLIDVHHHIVPKEYVEALEKRGVRKALGVRFPKWSAEKSLEVMDQYGISAAVLSLSAPGVYFSEVNEPLGFAAELARQANNLGADLIKEHPKRFGAFATIPLPDVKASIDELKSALDEKGLDGIILLSNYDGYYLGDSRFDRLFAELDRRRAVVFVHPASPPGIGASHLGLPEATMDVCFDTTKTAFSLIANGVTKRYPGVRFILAHAGGVAPYIAGRVGIISSLMQGLSGPAAGVAKGVGLMSKIVPGMRERLPDELDAYLQFKENMPEGPVKYLGGFYYDTAMSASPHVFASLLTVCGSSQVLFGSDFPFATEPAIPTTIQGIEEHQEFASQDLAAIRRENSARLFTRLN
jgi:predicted TIM-barrel fold metal-dependent hydrolase